MNERTTTAEELMDEVIAAKMAELEALLLAKIDLVERLGNDRIYRSEILERGVQEVMDFSQSEVLTDEDYIAYGVASILDDDK